MSLVEHLRELRRRVIISAVAVAVGGVLGFALYDWVIDILKEPYTDITGRTSFIVFDPLEQFTTRFKVSAYVGLLVASPVVLWQLWRFITPGLYEKEKRYAVPFVAQLGPAVHRRLPAGLLDLPAHPRVLRADRRGEPRRQLHAGQVPRAADHDDAGLRGRLRVPGRPHLPPDRPGRCPGARWSHWRRYAIVSIFVVGAVITPSGDPVTLLALSVPICILYEISILLGRFVISKN